MWASTSVSVFVCSVWCVCSHTYAHVCSLFNLDTLISQNFSSPFGLYFLISFCLKISNNIKINKKNETPKRTHCKSIFSSFDNLYSLSCNLRFFWLFLLEILQILVRNSYKDMIQPKRIFDENPKSIYIYEREKKQQSHQFLESIFIPWKVFNIYNFNFDWSKSNSLRQSSIWLATIFAITFYIWIREV